MDVDTMTKPAHPSAKSAVEARALRADIYDFNSAYAACIDDGDIMQWPDFFTEDAIYKVIPRENYDQGLPLATIFAEGIPPLEPRHDAGREFNQGVDSGLRCHRRGRCAANRDRRQAHRA